MPKRRPQAGPWTVRIEIVPGLEEVLRDELVELGVEGISLDKGGVEARMDPATLLKVQRWSRIASRATVHVARVSAPSLQGLADRVRGLPWHLYVRPRQPVQVEVSSSRSRLRNRKAVASKVELAVQDALKKPRRLPRAGRPPRTPVTVGVRIVDDHANIRVDASGELLHKRGWRVDPGRAPLRENLAVALLRAAGWQPGETLVDPMAGSGTFGVEAALWTLGRAPGAHRSFACEAWASWSDPKVRDPARPPDTGAPILCADRDARSIKRVLKNARRARVEQRLQVQEVALADLEPPTPTGLLVMNPPWGDRLGNVRHAEQLHRQWRGVLSERWPGYRVAVLTPDAPWARAAWSGSYRATARFRSGGTAVCVWQRDAV